MCHNYIAFLICFLNFLLDKDKAYCDDLSLVFPHSILKKSLVAAYLSCYFNSLKNSLTISSHLMGRVEGCFGDSLLLLH